MLATRLQELFLTLNREATRFPWARASVATDQLKLTVGNLPPLNITLDTVGRIGANQRISNAVCTREESHALLTALTAKMLLRNQHRDNNPGNFQRREPPMLLQQTVFVDFTDKFFEPFIALDCSQIVFGMMFLACSVHYFASLFPSTHYPSLMTDVTLYFEANYAGSRADFTWSVSCPLSCSLSLSVSLAFYTLSLSLPLSLSQIILFLIPFIILLPSFLSLPC